MATDKNNHDPLRNPQVDYDRSDLSPRGILLFLIGLFVAAVFIELVIWGMFRFMARSEALFPQPQPNPMMNAQKVSPPASSRSVLQNAPAVNLQLFPEPRLQANDAGDMSGFFESEQKLLNPEQPFTDPNGVVHIPITLAMKLVQERGLPVRPNAPPPDINTQTAAGNTKMLDMQAGPLGSPASQGSSPNVVGGNKTAGGEQKQ
jgi:hypothetical protein